ncbi:MAG: hypothetical protein HC841_03630 [Verrucomicrobiae bacterium]|nr:hypothetical protein [Verrucomicrobiae bacterium]
MRFTDEHRLLRDSLRRLIDTEINPHVEAWEEAKSFPAHALFRKLGASTSVVAVDRHLTIAQALVFVRSGVDIEKYSDFATMDESKLDPAQAWTKTRDLPTLPAKTFRDHWRERNGNS